MIRILRAHREKILDMELIHQRFTAVEVDLYAMGAVISKLQDIAEHPRSNGESLNDHRDMRHTELFSWLGSLRRHRLKG